MRSDHLFSQNKATNKADERRGRCTIFEESVFIK